MRATSCVSAAFAAVAAMTALVWGIKVLIRFHAGDAVVVQWWHLYALGNGILWVLAIAFGAIAILALRDARRSS
ncbi:MAG TPA: hypothetical protein VLG09_04170 [Candidatus Saccharimonadales bacterium]|nr:hypothetical protein [Candidatus Saccharimonadales bacterium]